MNTSQIKNFAIQSRVILKAGVLNRILMLGFNDKGELIVDRPIKIQGGTVFMDQLREESFYDAWIALEARLAKHGIKEVCEEAAYTWFNRLVAIRIMQKNNFIEPVMQYVSQETRIPVIVDQARSGRLSLRMTAQDQTKLDDLLRDSTKTNEQFNLLISAFCQANPVIFNCFGGIEKHISLLLPDNILSQDGFIDLLNNTPYLTDEDYTKSELIGWLYQFYISEKKDEVFAKKGKYTPDEIPAATQIFTPNWIVKYMVENTIGRIYLDNNQYADEIKDSMEYLVEPSEPTPKDAILKLEDLTEYKMIDNACGSGHILIEGFNLFYRLYQYEGYASRQAIENILRKNIIGLDLDTRAKQLATFALLMTAAKIDKSFLDCKVMPRVLDFPEPFVCHEGTCEDLFSHYYLGCSEKVIKETRDAFELLKDASSLGSIMTFELSAETRAAMEKATAEWDKKKYVPEDFTTAMKSMKVILALTDKYSAICANPPYMGNGNMNDTLSSYVRLNYKDAKADLMCVFMLVAARLSSENGRWSMINIPSWMFISSFEALRDRLINDYQISSLLHLGRGIFGSDFGTVAFTVLSHEPVSKGIYRRLFKQHVQVRTVEQIEGLFLNPQYGYYQANQKDFLRIKGHPFGYWVSELFLRTLESKTLAQFGTTRKGMYTGLNDKYVRTWYEVAFPKIGLNLDRTQAALSGKKWFPYANGGDFRKWYGNFSDVVVWENDGEELRTTRNSDGKIRAGCFNLDYIFKEGIFWSSITASKYSMKLLPKGHMFSSASNAWFPSNMGITKYVLANTNSCVARASMDIMNPTLNVNAGDIINIPIKVDEQATVESTTEKCIAISKYDWDAHETSWDFKVNELVRIFRGVFSGEGLYDNAYHLENIATLYKEYWTEQFNELHSNEEELNRQFIEIYGLQDELTPDVPFNEITILQNGEISIEDNKIIWHDDVLIKQLISYAIGCWMGRYRLDKEGLNIAYYPSDEEICTYKYNGAQFGIDDDAIIPLMVGNNPFEDDNALQKIINFVRIVFGEKNLTKNLNFFEHCLGKSLENYLVKDFWKDHKKMYQNRPIYWLFTSKKGAFQVLTYMHRMNPYTVEKIRTKYLLPYIDYLKGRIEVDEARGSELSSVERSNLAKMRVALDECNEYHDRLHEVAIQAIDFDLDDGVVVNYAKFGDVVAKIK